MKKNKLTGNLPVKILAVFLATITMLLTAAGAAAIYAMAATGRYTMSETQYRNNVLETIMTSKIQQMYNLYSSGGLSDGNYSQDDESNALFSIIDGDGNELFNNYNGQGTQYRQSEIFETDVYPELSEEQFSEKFGYDAESGERTIKISVIGYLKNDLTSKDSFWLAVKFINFSDANKYNVIITTVLLFMAMLVLMIFLYCGAGHRNGTDGVRLGYLGRIPFDLTLAFTLAAVAVSVMMLEPFSGISEIAIVAPFLLTADYLVFLGCTVSLAANIKTGGLIRRTVIYRILRLIWHFFKWLGRGISYILHGIPFIWKCALSVFIISVLELIGIAVFDREGEIFVLWFISRLVLIPALLYIAITLAKLKHGGEKIADGNLDYQIETKYMYGDFKSFALSLNSINSGMSHAVDERMKSERFKTELITNVSHDIKTPLTSIINYVDLIKKEKPENENVKQYIEVLDRQSSRLKKLIEDLVEASKASTGNLAVSFTECETGVLLSQAVGEYDEKLAAHELVPVITQPEKPMYIMADGRHLWRVFDNLMNNICKYAMPHTRVYIEILERGGKVMIVFKNISKNELNISSDELMERFVRGDSSRNTEGSGLGLSIAKSLTELQHGQLLLSVDGDLFKVTLVFDRIYKQGTEK